MAKLKLVARQPLTLASNWILPVIESFIDLKISTEPLLPGDCYYTNEWNETAQNWAEQGQKVILDSLWEVPNKAHSLLPCFVLHNWSWFWYQESLWYRYLGYNNFVPAPAWTHRALMPIRRQLPIRNFIIQQLEPNLHKFIWSYQAKGRNLPDDLDPTHLEAQRYFNPYWYNSTAMSFVIESFAGSNRVPTTPFITEKTFKPIAFRHPFVVAGDSNTLTFLHKLGFESFENLFDESYDQILVGTHRCRAAIKSVLDYQPTARDHLTQQKLDHNHARFFDHRLVAQKIQEEIIEPILEYAET